MRSFFIDLKNKIVSFLNLKFQFFGAPRLSDIEITRKVIQPGKYEKFSNLLTIDDKPHWKFRLWQEIHFPETFVAELNDGRVWGNQGAVITRDNIFLQAVSREYKNEGKNHSIFKQWRIGKPRYLDATVAIIAASGADVYYHWMMDIIPRIDLLIKGNLIEAIDYFIINYTGLPFQSEILNKLNIDEKKIICSNNHWNFHITAKNLVVPSLVSPNNCPSEEACIFLKSIFAENRSSKKPYRRLYVQRSKGRTISNEQEIIEIILEYGFEIVQPELMSVAEQAFLYSEADFVMAPHGAGLTNLVFCEPGTKVIDLFSPQWVNPCYWILSSHMGLRYSYLIGEGKKIRENFDPKNKAADINIDSSKLKTLIKLVSS